MIDQLFNAAIETAQASVVAHKAVFANPQDKSLVDALKAAMIAERQAREAYQEASGRTFDLETASERLNRKAEAEYDKRAERCI